VFGHSIEAFKVADESVRWAALLHDIGKLPAVTKTGSMKGHENYSVRLAEKRLLELKMPTEKRKKILKLIALHMTDIEGDMREDELKIFCAENAPLTPDLAKLRDADLIATTGKQPTENRFRTVLEMMKSEGTPMSVKELKISGSDLVEMRVPRAVRGKLLDDVWREAVKNKTLRTKEEQIEYAKGKLEEWKLDY
jgi:CRISPR/Cas system-associated endonuclease Cas3-HD